MKMDRNHGKQFFKKEILKVYQKKRFSDKMKMDRKHEKQFFFNEMKMGISVTRKKALKETQVMHAQKQKWRACTDVEIVLKERATSDHSSDQGSLHSPCSGVLTCFRSLHTSLGLSPFVPGHELCLITDSQGQ